MWETADCEDEFADLYDGFHSPAQARLINLQRGIPLMLNTAHARCAAIEALMAGLGMERKRCADCRGPRPTGAQPCDACVEQWSPMGGMEEKENGEKEKGGDQVKEKKKKGKKGKSRT